MKLLNKLTKVLMVILLAITMLVTSNIINQNNNVVYAADGDPGMSKGTGVLQTGANTANAQTLWYGENVDNAVTWRVIGYNGSGAASSANNVTLLYTREGLETTYFNNSGNGNAYANSLLKTAIDNIKGNFGDYELGAVTPRDLSDVNVEGAYLWALSTTEANEVDTDLRVIDSSHTGWASSHWWLRSVATLYSNYVAYVEGNGSVNSSMGEKINPNNGKGIRPAFDLKINSVLFTSTATGGKVGDGDLAEQTANTGNEWKVTLIAGHPDFEVIEAIKTDNGVSVDYKGAVTGGNEYISAVILDSAGNVKYYGRIQASSSEEGTVTINTENKLEDTDELYLFNENYNGDKKTDYASELQKVNPLTVEIEVSPESVSMTAKVGYKSDDEGLQVDITATSKGTKEITEIDADFKDSASNELFELSVEDMVATISPKEGLPVGTYTAIVVISDKDDRCDPVEVRVTFTVTDKEIYTITYDLDGGTLYGQTGSVKIDYVEDITITLPRPTKQGYTFDYWEGSRYDAGDKYTVVEDHTFKAIWIEDEKPQPKPTPKPQPSPTPYVPPKTGVE